MSNKLLEAAKRLYGYVEHGLSLSPLSLVAKDLQHAIAAEEQRIAEEQLPATREWLTDVLQLLEDDRWQVYEAEDIATKSMQVCVFYGKCVMMKRPTSRQVLALLEAMGVKP